MAIKAGIIGAAGFAGAELVRLLTNHPAFEVAAVTSDSLAGTEYAAVNPTFAGLTDLRFTPHDGPELLSCDAVFLAVPHTAALKHVPALLEAGVSAFDLSADYRLKDRSVYESWYGVEHTSPELLGRAAYGIPELFREEMQRVAEAHARGEAVLVACAGCYPTATSLAAYPAVHAGLVGAPVVVDAISGVTGAGKAATERTHFCFANENLEAYKVGNHRHVPEIEQTLGMAGQVVFTPHLAPLNRGLLSTVYLPLKGGADARSIGQVEGLYREFYRTAPFVTVLEPGVLPRTASVAGSNYAQVGLSLHEPTGTLVAIAAIDNLCKGASGQAVQCANIVFGLDESSGLASPAAYV